MRVFSLKEIEDLYSQSIDGTITIDNCKVSIKGNRPEVFITKGYKCANQSCHFCGVYWEFKKGPGGKGHLQLIGANPYSGEKMMMTQDHILASSLGGSHDISNLQPLCHRCNTRKATDESRVLTKLQMRALGATEQNPVVIFYPKNKTYAIYSPALAFGCVQGLYFHGDGGVCAKLASMANNYQEKMKRKNNGPK
ncbi:HNHc domain containing protein [uncultured Caudovirales phage]|uniref:HNHc domain containing protein n=1 Tax=uncultured Caudovirales phage TaxID=2100421 RepID=A0A6J5MHJ0_9CAUD|nr:HNHc domain containing protein [uncultured Caudovirales phage]